jgi:hypothetical protein
MPLNAYTDVATQELLAKMEADLSYLFDELQIPERIQANIAERGIVHIGVFAKVEPTEESFRNWLKDDLELDPAANMGNRVIVAKLAEAWSAAGQRSTTARRLDAEARVTGQPREMLKGIHLTLRRACAKAHGAVDDRRCPGRAYVEARLEQLDDGELEAEALTKVTTVSLEQESVGTDQASGVDVRRDGLLHIVKGKRSAPLPTNPEQLRDVFRVMGLHWEMVHLKGAGRAVLKDYSPSVFDKHVEFLLGDECYRISEANPTMACRPSWDLLLKYDFELRKYAIKRVNEGSQTLAEAVEAARNSMELRTKFFITPLAMPAQRVAPPKAEAGDRGVKRAAAEALPAQEDRSSKGRGRGRDGKGKGRDGKGKDKPLSAAELRALPPKSAYRRMRNSPQLYGLQLKGPGGEPSCHAFQIGECKKTDCSYNHVCARCGGPHAVVACPDLGLDRR